MNRKNFVITVLITAVLLTMFFTPLSTQQGVREYDPWYDINDDGTINIIDIARVAMKFGTIGTAINKTALLLALDTRVPKEGLISVPAAAFTPYYPGRPYENNGYRLLNEWSDPTQFVAPIQLPDGAAVTQVECYWYDSSGSEDILFWLFRYDIQGNFYLMSSFTSRGVTGKGITYDYTIDYASVDNHYGYFLKLQLWPFPDHVFYYAVIDYEYPA